MKKVKTNYRLWCECEYLFFYSQESHPYTQTPNNELVWRNHKLNTFIDNFSLHISFYKILKIITFVAFKTDLVEEISKRIEKLPNANTPQSKLVYINCLNSKLKFEIPFLKQKNLRKSWFFLFILVFSFLFTGICFVL